MLLNTRSTRHRPSTHKGSLRHVSIPVWLGSFVLIIALFATLTLTASASPMLALSVTATKTDAIIGDDGDNKADPGETIEYTVTINASGGDATGVTLDDTPDANTTFVGGSTAASPVAVNDTFPVTVLGNVSIDSAALTTPFSVTSNDYLGLNPTATISAFDATSANGGNVTMTTSGVNMGKFTYNPPPGFEGTDTFTYTLSDNANATSASANRTATVSITVSGMIWFINNNAASCTTLVAGCGRLSNPFSTLAAFSALNNGTGNNPAANDNIFIYESATQYTGAVTLLTGQKLIGQDATVSLSTLTGLTPPTGSPVFPAMNSGNATVTNIGSTVTLNTNVTVRGLQINSTSSTGMNDPVGAITGVSVSEVRVTTTTGTAVSLSSAGGTFSFISISANGGSNGIVLNNTTGSFTVTGTGGTCTEANTSGCTGGVIQNMTGADDSTATPIGTGIVLNNAASVSLTRMYIHDHSNYGIRGTSVNGFTLDNSVVSGVNGTNVASPYSDSSISFDNLAGTSAITNSAISGGYQRNIRVDNTTGTLTLTINSNSIHNTGATAGDDGILVEVGGGNATLNITNNTFAAHGGDHFNLSLLGSPTVDLTFTGNLWSGGHAIGLGQGLYILGASFDGTFTYDILNNGTAGSPLVGNRQGGAMHVNKGSGIGTFSGTISGNYIGNAAVNGSGSSEASGIDVEAHGSGGSHTTVISNNTVRQFHNDGILLVAGEGSAALNATVTGNTVTNPDNTIVPLHGIHFNIGTLPADNMSVCLDVKNNSLSTAGAEANGGVDLRMRQRQLTTVRLPGYAGANNNNTAVQTFLTGTNSNVVTTILASNTVATGGGGFVGGVACAQPAARQPKDDRFVVHNQAETGSLNNVPASNTHLDGANAFKQTAREVETGNQFAPSLASAPSAPLVSVSVGMLPSGKSVTIKFRVTVNGPSLPLGTTQISNQGTVTGSNFSSILTDDPAVGGASDPTITPVDRPDTAVASIDRAGSSPTSADAVSWTVTFTTTITSLTSSNFNLVNTGLGGTPTITNVVAVGGPPASQWTVTASAGTGNGTLGLNMVNDPGLSHDVTNLTFTGQVYAVNDGPSAVTLSAFDARADAVAVPVALAGLALVTGVGVWWLRRKNARM